MSKDALTAHTAECRIGRDIVARVCRDAYAADPELQDLVKWHHGFTVPRRLSWAAAAREAELEPGMIYNAWRGDLNGDAPAYKAAIKRLRKEAAAAGRVSFCETSFSKVVWEAHEVAAFTSRESRAGTMVYIRGDAGTGKTLVSRAWCQTNNHGRSYFFQPKGYGGSRGLLNECAALMGLDRTANALLLCERVFESFEPGMVLVVDEVALLVRATGRKQPMLDLIRRISDITGCAVIALATDDKFESDVAGSSWNDRQWWRRQSRIIDLPKVATDQDVTTLYEFKFPDLDLDDVIRGGLLEVNSHDKGGFGQVAKILDDAQLLARRAGRKPSVTDLATCLKLKLKSLDAVRSRSRR
jgi:DNA transposition AAA+ family ATPase